MQRHKSTWQPCNRLHSNRGWCSNPVVDSNYLPMGEQSLRRSGFVFLVALQAVEPNNLFWKLPTNLQSIYAVQLY